MEAQPIRVLLVDDDASFLNSLEALLVGEPGLEIVGKAASGTEALAAAARAEPDVAVIDVLMPTMSGMECAHLLQERYPKARVILISGSIFEDKRPQPDERGTDAYLEKSEVPERLHATILALKMLRRWLLRTTRARAFSEHFACQFASLDEERSAPVLEDERGELVSGVGRAGLEPVRRRLELRCEFRSAFSGGRR
jgi:DNA-binding NarL/FixJ family response regulator